MEGFEALLRAAAAGWRAGRARASMLGVAAIAVCAVPQGAVGSPAAPAPPQRQYAQVRGYVGEAPATTAAPPAGADQAAPPPREQPPPPKPKGHGKQVGFVKVHPEDPKDDEKIYLDFTSVSKALNLDKHEGERSDIREHFRAHKGSKVEWSGMVYRVRLGRRGYEIQVKNHAVPTDGAYNIVLKGDEREEARDVDDDDEIWFTGEIADYKPGRGERGAIVVLTDGDIEKKKSR
jgi:hypothetical protein